MSNPMDYDALPHPTDRAIRTRQAIGYLLEFGGFGPVDGLIRGTGYQDYTFGILDDSGHFESQIVRTSQIGYELGSLAVPRRVFVIAHGIARQAVLPTTAHSLGLRQQPRQFRLTLDNIDTAIVPADDPRLDKVQLVA